MSGVVNLFVVSPDTRSERRLDPHMSIGKLKDKLELITGIPASNQVLSLVISEDDPTVVAQLADDTQPLGFYGARDWQVLKVEDTNPSVSFTGQLTDVSQVNKFELTDAEYAARQDTVLAYKQRHKVGRFASKDSEPDTSSAPTVDLNSIPVGARCEIESLEQGLNKRGTVRFVGGTKFASGAWVGVEYDEPFGKNDGAVAGQRYFTCRQNYGAFVRPDKVRVGDYPMEELDLDEDEEM